MIIAPSHGEIWAAGLVFPIICGVAIALRFYIRRHRRVELLADDWLTIPAWLLVTGVGATIIYASEHDVFIQDNVPTSSVVTEGQRRHFPVMKLRLKTRRKFALVITFLVGCLAFVAGLLNTVLQILYITNTDVFSDAPNAELPDQIFFYWQTIEIGVGLLFCNLPIHRPLYNSALVRLHSASLEVRSFVMSRSRSNQKASKTDVEEITLVEVSSNV
ncbi:MAG: hypothetical protein Q9159_007359 [Coniocarpon cinnabarinum]